MAFHTVTAKTVYTRTVKKGGVIAYKGSNIKPVNRRSFGKENPLVDLVGKRVTLFTDMSGFPARLTDASGETLCSPENYSYSEVGK